MNYLNESQEFIEASKRATDLVELGSLFEQTISRMGCTHFACTSNVDPLHPPSGAVGVSNYPSTWAHRFSAKKYQFIDPIYKACQTRLTPFMWSDKQWRAILSVEQLNVLNEAAEVGLGDGFSVPIHCTEGFPASCSIVFGQEDLDPDSINTIHLMSIYLYESALRLKLDSSPYRRPILTTRQRECLEFAALGKSSWVISQLLNISESTVHFHFGMVLKRLRVATRTQAIVKALFLGEIRFADISMAAADPVGFTNIDNKWHPSI